MDRPAAAGEDGFDGVERHVVFSHNENHVGQLTAAERHLEVLRQLVTIAVLLVDTVHHWRWWAGGREKEGERERGGEGRREREER